ILNLPRLSRKTFDSLKRQNITTIPRIPADHRLTDAQRRVRQAVVSRKPVFSKPGLAQFLKQVVWPAFYLDFETVKTALPLYPGVKPHEQVVTQYSIHVCRAPGKVIEHREFLADPLRDSRRELAERLLDDLAGDGRIIVYSGFEKTTLTGL